MTYLRFAGGRRCSSDSEELACTLVWLDCELYRFALFNAIQHPTPASELSRSEPRGRFRCAPCDFKSCVPGNFAATTNLSRFVSDIKCIFWSSNNRCSRRLETVF